MGRLTGKIAVVTGAGSGIGRASATIFAREGAKIIAADVSEGVYETVEAIIAAGGVAQAVIADAGNEDDVKGLVAKAQADYGGLNVVYANAGISGGHVPLAEQTIEAFQEILRVNLIGPFLMVKHAGPVMAAGGGGSIVMTASVAGLRSNAGGIPYAASKAGVISLAQTSAYNLFGSNVRVNAICPGLIETGMTKPIFDMAAERGTTHKIGQLNPLQRNGLPEEIANAALFLASDEASYVNGQAYAVCGGLSAGHPFSVPGKA